SDLDLHVVDPDQNEIFHGAPSSRPPASPGRAPSPDAGGYGALVADSNAQCVIDGRRMEAVVWTDTAPRGHRLVRVDTASRRGAPIARWTVRAVIDGVQVAAAQGTSIDSDTRGAHDRGAGLTALQFDVP